MSDNTERCGHMLCNRTAYERSIADAECALSDCPFREPPAPPEPALSPLARAVKEARGGDAPVESRGFA